MQARLPQAKAQPQDRILDAAMRVFRRHGFRRSSIEQAAEEAGLTRQALYHHFASKEALFRAVIERLYQGALDAEIAAARAAEEKADSLADILIAGCTARLQHLFGSLEGSPHLEELFSEHLAQCRDLYQAYAERFSTQLAATIARVCGRQRLALVSGMSPRELARCVELASKGVKSAYPSMLPVEAFIADHDRMLRLVVGGAIAPRAGDAAKKSNKKSKRSQPGDRK